MNNRYCIACGKAIEGNNEGMHARCIRELFGRRDIPVLDIEPAGIPGAAQKMAGHMSISGVQPKLSLKVQGNKLLTTETGGQYILKPQTERFLLLPENENLCMNIFNIAGIETAKHTLLHFDNGINAYIVKRFDRDNDRKIHCEDFTPVLGHSDKYRGSVEQIGKAIMQYTKFPGLEAQKFFKMVIMNFILGNGDAHLKNYLLLYDEEGNKSLAPAFDIVSSKLVIEGEKDTALTLSSKDKNLKRENFIELAQYLDINEKVYSDMIDEIIAMKEDIISVVNDYPYMNELKEQFIEIITEEFKRISR